MRLDSFLAAQPELELTRSAARKLCADGRVLLGGVAAKPSTKLKGGESLAVTLPIPFPSVPGPEDIDLPIVHLDDDLVVVDKPSGMVVHPAPGHPTGTVVNALLHRVGDLASSDDPSRPGIVHRLDRYTSGLMVVARSIPALVGLQEAIRARTVTRQYLLVVRDADRLAEGGSFDTAYGRNPRDRKRMSSRHEGPRRAVTHWRKLEELLGQHALVEATLETGRTHQIRVHFADARYPVLGDSVYSRPDAQLDRQFLHAAELRFEHPVSGEPLAFTSALPADLAERLSSLRPRGEAV